jgi:hypothetical protein
MAQNSFPFTTRQDFQGIIAGLTSHHGGNVHDSGLVYVTASSTGEGSHREVVDFSSSTGLCTKLDSQPWICYEFRRQIVKPTGCAIAFQSNGAPGHERVSPLTFGISMDGSHWTSVAGVNKFESDALFWALRFPKDAPEGRFLRMSLACQRQFGEYDPSMISVSAWVVYGEIRVAGDRPIVRPDMPAALEGSRGWLSGWTSLEDAWPTVLHGIGHFLRSQNPEDAMISTSDLSRQAFPLLELSTAQLALPRKVWMVVTFPNGRIQLTHYAILLSHANRRYGWELSTLLDGRTWTSVDSRTDAFKVGARPFALGDSVECSRVRLMIGTSPSSAASEYVLVTGFDVFGTILD